MNAIKRNIPNIITLANLFCGLSAILFAFEGNLVLSATFIFCGAFFDFIDGLFARILEVKGELGKQLDSMADMVTFGVAPGMILFQLIYYVQVEVFFQSNVNDPNLFPAILGFLLPVFSAIRLSKFNIDKCQATSFIGLPTPVAALFIASLPLITYPFFSTIQFLTAISIILPILLVIKIPLISLKLSKGEVLHSRLNIFRIILIIGAIILLFFFMFAAIPFIVILYLFLSILNNIL
jgi:CDP-diacylglycerol--serine O-phosphatidyltransferase|tara:strand:- start:711 stop:1421 length:711 start_codon:yes stop_codon:yes gene_type:complete